MVGRRSSATALAAAMLVVAAQPALAGGRGLAALGLVARAWNAPDGLPQATVTGIAQTPDGYLWVTTFGGLVRFDGMQFHPAGAEDGLPPRLLRPWVGRDGVLWIVPETGGLWRRDARSGAFVEVADAAGIGVYAVLDAADGSLWLATSDRGAVRLRGAERHEFARSAGVPGTSVTALAEGADGTIWIGTDNGVARIDGDAVTAVAGDGALAGAVVSALLVRRSGDVAVGTIDGRLCAVRGETAACRDLVTGNTGRFVTGIAETADGTVWVSSFGGLYRVGAAGVERFDESAGLGDTVLKSLYLDREANLWLGTNAAGLVLLRERTFAVVGRAEGLASDQVLAVTVDTDGAPLVGLNCGPVSRIVAGRAQALAPGDSTLSTCAWSLLRDRGGALWVGTWGEGVVRHARDGVRRRILGVRHGDNVVTALFERRSGEIWAGTLHGGACRVDRDPPECLSAARELADDNVRAFAETPDGALWIATSGGVTRWDGREARTLGGADGMRSPLARALHVDRAGELWVGTYGGGLALIRERTALPVTVEHGLLDDVVSFIGEDDDGAFWLAGNRGVFRVARADLVAVAEGRQRRLYPSAFGVEDGMPSEECAGGFQPAGARTPDGRLWFPTVRGLVSVDPRAVPRRAPRAAVVEGIEVDSRSMPVAAAVTLPREFRQVRIAYGGLDLAAARKLIFRYRLAGVDREWVDAGARRAAHFGNLRAGSYRFEVQAFSPDGGWGPVSPPLELVVPALPWHSWWFLLAAAAAAAVVIYSLGALRVAQRSRREREHAAIARRLTAAILHEFRQPLQVLCARAEIRRLREGRATEDNDTERALHRLGELLDRLEALQSSGATAKRRYGSDEDMADLAGGDGRQ